MTPRDLAYEALSMIGIDALTSTRRTDAMLRRIANDITATLQQVYTSAPAIYKSRLSALLPGPKTITVSVTKGSTAFTTGDTYTVGSTIRITGDDVFNEIVDTETLMLPFKGPTGSVSATVWHDSIPLPVTVSRVSDSVMVNETPIMWMEDARGQFIAGRQRREAGTPMVYWVESMFADQTPNLKIRVFPMPDRDVTFAAEVENLPPVIEPDDIGDDDEDPDPGTTIPVQNQYTHSIVRPIFLVKWASGPWYRREADNLRSLKEDEAKALALLNELSLQNRRHVATRLPFPYSPPVRSWRYRGFR